MHSRRQSGEANELRLLAFVRGIYEWLDLDDVRTADSLHVTSGRYSNRQPAAQQNSLFTVGQACCFQRKLHIAQSSRALVNRCSSKSEGSYQRETDSVRERVLTLDADRVLVKTRSVTDVCSGVVQPDLRVGRRRLGHQWMGEMEMIAVMIIVRLL